MKKLKYILRFLIIVYPFLCIYPFFNADKYDNIFWGISMVIGGFVTIFGGIMLVFLTIGLIAFILQTFINWVFERDIFD